MGHLWLVGMMGSGKTTVGALTAGLLSLPFVDTDARIAERSGRSVKEIFEDGEIVFRRIESQILAEVALERPSVIATGGGAVLSAENVVLMRASGMIVLLEVDAGTIAERVKLDAERPLLVSGEGIVEVLEERRELYRAVADWILSSVGRTPEEVAKEVAACVDT